MASRMERYNKYHKNGGRSQKNEELYRAIYERDDNYNIEGVARLDKTNEIDIAKIKELLENRKENKKRKRYEDLLKETETEVMNIEEEDEDDETDNTNYDIRDILSKAKEDKSEEIKNDYHSLNNTQYNILKNLKLKDKVNTDDYIDDEDPEIKKLINTITSTSKLSNLNDKELSLDLLSDLKSDTMTSSKTLKSIEDIITEDNKEKKDNTAELELDKSFFTSAYSFGKDDFDVDENGEIIVKKKHTGVKILIFILILIIIAGIGAGIYLMLK